MKIVILAAGQGKRMKSEKPKVLHTIAGVPLLEYVFRTAKALSSQIYCVIGYKADEIIKKFPQTENIKYCVQEPQLGTGHALMIVKEQFEADFKPYDDVLILLGDVPMIQDFQLRKLFEIFEKRQASAAMLTVNVLDAKGYGRVLRDKHDEFIKVVEDRDASEREKQIQEINTGLFVFKAGALFANLEKLQSNNAQKEYYLPDVLPFIRSDGGKCLAVNCREISVNYNEVLGINNRQQLAEVEAMFQRQIKNFHFDNGVSIVDPENTYIEQDVEIGSDTVIFPYTVIRRGVKIGKHCEVGPFAHLRAGTVLEDTAEIGDFCEAKNAVLKPHVKAKHLSYLGDVIIGKGTNIGAGTIIANYDGKKKHQTIIGNDCFIGSGSILVAPVKIGNGATTGAGSVVTRNKDVPDGTTVIGIPAKPLKPKPKKN